MRTITATFKAVEIYLVTIETDEDDPADALREAFNARVGYSLSPVDDYIKLINIEE